MNEEILRILKNSEGYVSGENISSRLKVTRAAIWKAISNLRAQGYNIVSKKHYGYMLINSGDIFNEYELNELLAESELLNCLNLTYFQEIDSTNLAARREVDKFDGVSLFVADQQSTGRGRLGRDWKSEANSGLWFSLLLLPRANADKLANLTLFTGLCVQRALVKHTGLDIGIKWPNDLIIMSSGRKTGGILTETVLEDMAVKAVIIGVGINVNNSSFPSDIEHSAGSLRLESGHSYNRASLLIDILHEFLGNYHEFENTDNNSKEPGWLSSYKQACATLGRHVAITSADGSVEKGTAEDLTVGGDLVVRLDDGSSKIYHSGEVSVRGLAGYI